MTEDSEKVPARPQQQLAWQTPTLTRVGSFGDVLAGGSKPMSEGGMMMALV